MSSRSSQTHMNCCGFHCRLKTVEAIEGEIIPVGGFVPSSLYPLQVSASKIKFFISCRHSGSCFRSSLSRNMYGARRRARQSHALLVINPNPLPHEWKGDTLGRL